MFRAAQFIRTRLGQGAFRLAAPDAYACSCAATGEHGLPVLDAAHIQPFGEGGAHEITNGMLLRAHRATIRLPANPAHRPDRDRLAWHLERRFRG